jgi:alpha-1,3-rhamnosyl/mannosyltransferase
MTGGISRSVEHADQIITGSEYIRKELLERYRLDERRVTATPYAADASYCPRGEQDCRDVLAKYGLRYKHFLLVVGSVEPRKNLSLLMDAYGDLPEDVKTNYPLVHVGPAGWNNSKIKPKTDALAAVGWFRSLGYVPQDDLPAIFSAAAGLAFPSIYEGFGLPPLEAMSSGIPLLAGNASSIPELVGDCGILVDPHSREALSRGLAKLLGGGLEIEHMVEAGLQRAKSFSWRRTAECTFDVYIKAQAGRG